MTRRGFLGRAGSVAAASATAGVLGTLPLPRPGAVAAAGTGATLTGHMRAEQAFTVRVNAARYERALPLPDHPANDDETRYGASHIGSFSKGLPHNALGEVDPSAYAQLRAACVSGLPADFEAVPLGGKARLANPLSSYAYALEGVDIQCLYTDPAPAFASATVAAEMAELYWQALARDVPFAAYGSDPLIARAAGDLSRLATSLGMPAGSAISADTIFRGFTPGDTIGPHLSQFLLAPVSYGAMSFEQRYIAAPGIDYMTGFADWLAVQRGSPPAPIAPVAPPPTRYICTGRDLATFTHFDFIYQAPLNACLLLLHMGAPLNPRNPYRRYKTQTPGLTFGPQHILDLVAHVANTAAKASFYQKWAIHRRVRPEAVGARVHLQKVGAAGYPVHQSLLAGSAVLDAVHRKYGTYLLPMAYPEGAPLHPTYPAAHTTINAACITMLKAFFDESFVLPQPVAASADGQTLTAYSGPALTVGGELNKLASNIHMGRDFSGVHYRSDGTSGLLLGEAVALSFLRDEGTGFAEGYRGLSFTRFDGSAVVV